MPRLNLLAHTLKDACSDRSPIIPAVRSIAVTLLAAAWLGAACSGGQPATFSLTRASVDPDYSCPGGANNVSYDLHATIDVHNGTNKAVSIQSMTADLKLVAVKGNWLEKVGDRYDAGSVTYSPSTVAAGSSAALKVTIPSACTSDKYRTSISSYGSYEVTMHVTTSAGVFSITAQNQHEILTA